MRITQTDRELLGLCILAIFMYAFGVLYEQSLSSPVPSLATVVEETANETPALLTEEPDITSQESGTLEEICRQIEEDTRQETVKVTVKLRWIQYTANDITMEGGD